MEDTTQYTWIIAENTSAKTIRGVVEALDKAGALIDADVRIMTVSAEQGVAVPAGFTLPNGKVLSSGVLTIDNLPPQGILVQGIL